MDLQTSRVATISKLKREWERRERDNETAFERIRQNVRFWKHVCSLDPETLLRPSETDVATAQDAAAALKRMVDNRETGHEQLHVEAFVEDLA